MRTAWRCALPAILILLAVASAPKAAQWVVAQDGSGAFRSIQGAVDAASYGDVVYVSAGVYNERITLKDGVRVVGAGASATLVRHAYGFDEVVRIRNMSSGSLEKMTVERMASVLPGPAVSAASAAASLVDCTILGGQGAGVEAVGSACTLTIERTSVVANAGHGLYVHDGARAVVLDSRVEENDASGLVVGALSSVRISGTTISDNGRCGIALEGDADLEIVRSTVRRNPEWGILALGAASVRIAEVSMADNATGGLHLAGTTEVVVSGAVVIHCGDGVILAGAAHLDATDLRIHNVVGDGLRLMDESALAASGLEIVAASQNGLSLDTTGDVAVVRSTVIESGGDGLLVRAGRPGIRQTILAYNRGAGVRLDASDSPPPAPDLAYNAVWSNGEDYVGTSRPATDISASPELVDLDGRLALLPDSPCLEAGPAWSSVGSGGDAADLTTYSLDLVPRLDGWLGATWTSALRLGGFPIMLETFAVGCRWTGDAGRLNLAASLLGSWGVRATAHAEGILHWDAPDRGHAALSYGADGRLDASHSWASAWIGGDIETAGLFGGGRLSLAWPKGPWTADLALGLAGPLQLRFSAGVTGLTLRSLQASASASLPTAGGMLQIDGALSLLPVWEATADAAWTRDSEEWRAHVAYRPTEDALALSVAVGDAAARVEAGAHVVSGIPVDGDLSLVVGGSTLRARAGLAIDVTGARVRAGLELTLNGLLRKVPNEPPIPAFQSAPPHPEAQNPVRFLADASADPDGEIREIWWDFGDGSVAEGRVVEHAFTAPGEYPVSLTVSDDDGAVSSLTMTLLVWPADTTPVAAFVAYPVTAGGVRLPRPLRGGDLIRLDGAGSTDRDGSIVEYAWDVGADGTYDATSPDPSATVGPLEAGSIPVTLRVVDDTGRSDAVMQVVVIDKSAPPQAQFTFTPTAPAVRDPIRFTDRSTDTDGEVTAWEWDFGDGTTSREATPSHRYERVGRHTITLRVADDDGLSATAQRTLDVAALPEITDVGEVWAVLIGISDYAEVKDLQYAAADAAAMAQWLLGAGVAPDHIRLLLDRDGLQPDLGGLEARRATLVNVREALGWLRRMAKADDLVVIHFSGHGFQGSDDSGDEKDGVDEFFILWDTLNAAKEDTALRDDEFGAALDRIECEHVVVFFDGCYSGGLSRSLPSSARPAAGKQDLFSDFSVEGRIVFSASAESQDAFESDELRHGIFTYYIFDGLAGHADQNDDGRVTAWELYQYVVRQVPERALLEHNARQDPQLLGEGDVRVLLAEAARPPTADFGYRPDVPYAGGATAFTDQSTSGRRLIGRLWAFGDGTTSEETAPTHVYAKPGDYTVDLRVTQDDGANAATSQRVHVDAAAVMSTDPASPAVVLSLGRDHGVSVGDRFAAGGTDAAERTVIRVTEVVDGRTSAGRVVAGPRPELGATLVPLPPG